MGDNMVQKEKTSSLILHLGATQFALLTTSRRADRAAPGPLLGLKLELEVLRLLVAR